jgi:hypothetical protein
MTPEEFYAISARFDAAWKAQRWAVPAGTTYLDAPMADFINATRDDVLALLAEVERLRDANDRLNGMAEWLAEVIVDARDACQRVESITPMGSPDWVESGIAMRKTVLYEIRKVLDRERNAHPSRYDEARAEVARLRAQVAAVEALCEARWVYQDAPYLTVAEVRAALAEHTGEAS